jgi:hypothetical protein
MDDELVRRRRAIERAKSDLSTVLGPEVDPLIRASWLRCDPRLVRSVDGAPVDAAADTRERWDASPIRRAVPRLAEQLDQIATTSDLSVCVADADGRVLWLSTPLWLRRAAARIGFVPGGVWHEGSTGTNGIGLALASDRPAAVFASEHWLDNAHDWVCYGAPIHDPRGRQVGVIDMSTSWRRSNPLALTTVASIARLIEHALLDDHYASQSEPPALELRVLGEPRATLDGAPLRLTLRQFEILTLLAVLGSATLGDLHAHLYGDRPVALATLKAEMSRLRRMLGGRLDSRPYRVSLTCRVDAVDLVEGLDRGDIELAAGLYGGQLLLASESPFLAEHRQQVDVALRTALLRRGTSSAALRYTAVHPYDVEVLERARGLASSDDPLVPALTARLAVAVGA